MTRRPVKRRPAKRDAAPVTRVAWKADVHGPLFRLAGDDWTPPAEIVVRHGVRSWSLKADFTMPTGHPVRLTIRLTQTQTGPVVSDESMKLAFAVRGGAR